jgi:hypothetical protein
VETADEIIEPISPSNESPNWDIHIQGSDRAYPAVVIRRKERGPGGTIQTISKFGKFANIYNQYEDDIEKYKARRANTANSKHAVANSDGRIEGTREVRQDSDSATGSGGSAAKREEVDSRRSSNGNQNRLRPNYLGPGHQPAQMKPVLAQEPNT